MNPAPVKIDPPAPEPKGPSEVEKLLARIEQLEQKQSKPKRVVRDAQNRIVGVE